MILSKTTGRFMVTSGESAQMILRHLRPYVRWPGIDKQTAYEGICTKLHGDVVILNTDEMALIMDRLERCGPNDSLDEHVAMARLRQEMIVQIYEAEKAKILSEARM